jgi:hypothetical protein
MEQQQQSFTTNQSNEHHKQKKGFLHKSFHSSSNDSSTNYENNYSDSFSFDICYPKFKRSKSMKKSYTSQNFDKIIEERNEDDSFHSNFSERKKIFNINSIMPKDNLFFERKKLFKEPLNFNSKMELIPEIEDDNLAFQSPRIKLLKDHKEDKQIKQNMQNTSFKKEPIPENEIIKEENKEYCFEDFVRKFESFIDKEEPPENINNNNNQIIDNIPDIIPESNKEDDIHDEAKDIIRSNSLNINKKRFIDELDFINKNENTIKEFDVDDAINEMDEFNNNNKKENSSDENNENNEIINKEKSSSDEQD